MLWPFTCVTHQSATLVWCFGQAAKEEKLETDQEEDEHAAMTFLDNFPGNDYMIYQICGGWLIFYNTSRFCITSKVILPGCI